MDILAAALTGATTETQNQVQVQTSAPGFDLALAAAVAPPVLTLPIGVATQTPTIPCANSPKASQAPIVEPSGSIDIQAFQEFQGGVPHPIPLLFTNGEPPEAGPPPGAPPLQTETVEKGIAKIEPNAPSQNLDFLPQTEPKLPAAKARQAQVEPSKIDAHEVVQPDWNVMVAQISNGSFFTVAQISDNAPQLDKVVQRDLAIQAPIHVSGLAPLVDMEALPAIGIPATAKQSLSANPTTATDSKAIELGTQETKQFNFKTQEIKTAEDVKVAAGIPEAEKIEIKTLDIKQLQAAKPHLEPAVTTETGKVAETPAKQLNVEVSSDAPKAKVEEAPTAKIQATAKGEEIVLQTKQASSQSSGNESRSEDQDSKDLGDFEVKPVKTLQSEFVMQARNAEQSKQVITIYSKREITTTEMHGIIRQISDRMELLAAAKPRDGVVVHLNPDDLGSITLVIKSVGKSINAEIYTENQNVQTALQHNAPMLQQSMEARGMNLQSVTVTQNSFSTSTPQGEAQQQAHQNAQQQAPRHTFGEPRQATDMTPTPRAFRTASAGVDLWI